ncbi:hypothetical protein MKW98_009671 [Papaver atlanticum]|uniref:Prolamin-like domain-containing protein n=1 Tax=Papaver atlanticum TaxID=357466 RepID=A0AAD4S261_9MAGN|nr:hypothetical protein MKW98_020567 [Papaver atlanticum]KAI3960964.1 hypothetical protein MKW98_009671 [Papaver atlanticum]
MALFNGKLVLMFVISALMANTTTVLAGRDLATTIRYSVSHNLAARINGEDGAGMVECWNALYELRSCTNEIVLFFMDGEMYLGIECCRAIRIITREYILRGYCDASHSTAPRSSPVTVLPPEQITLAQPPLVGPITPSMVVV